MSFSLQEVVPWGRTYGEYLSMFSLSPADLQKHMLGCGDGPASFNTILTAQGGSVISADPLYSCSVDQIQKRIADTYEIVLEQTRKNKDEFVWDVISSVEQLGRIRTDAMREFLQDYETGRKENRYVDAGLPDLPFRDKEFDLALCSHFLFLYSEQFSEEFHFDSIVELCRVAKNVRIFPVLELGAIPSRHLKNIVEELRLEKYHVNLVQVDYEFQKGGNQMLVVEAETG